MKRALLIVLVLALFLPGTALSGYSVVLDVEPLYQKDYPDILFELNGKGRSVKEVGCGAVCVSMAIHFLAPEAEQTPETLFLWAYEQGLYSGNGLSMKTLSEMLRSFGLDVSWCGPYRNRLRRALRDNCPIIAYMSKGRFTDSGHYILICGINHKDEVRVIDPNSETRSNRWYPLKLIFHELGATSGFLICKKEEEPVILKNMFIR